MNEIDSPNQTGANQPGNVSGRRPLSLNRNTATVKQSFSHGRSKQVVVEKKKKRTTLGKDKAAPELVKPVVRQVPKKAAATRTRTIAGSSSKAQAKTGANTLSEEELRARQLALAQRKAMETSRRRALAESELDAQRLREAEARRLKAEQDKEEAKKAEEEEEAARQAKAKQETVKQTQEEEASRSQAAALAPERPARRERQQTPTDTAPAQTNRKKGRSDNNNESKPRPRTEPKRRRGKLTIAAALGEDEERQRSLASVRRARERERERRSKQENEEARDKVSREVVVPEAIVLQELANRMSERVSELIKFMMRQGEMVRAADVLDADTAELIVSEFGHRIKRVSEADVEIGLGGREDDPEDLQPRPPIVTVMGHVDHGKTSLLDAMRHTDIAAGEAGGITQHIGAWQIEVTPGKRITFIDTPGHAAFSAMRARGASLTDIVILVIAADDGIMPQTVEAINHAKSAEAPIIVAINKCDVPSADPQRIMTDLLNHDIQVEAHGGQVQAIAVSALTGAGLTELADAIILQAEMMELKANSDREADGTVIESRIDKGRGPLATVLVQRGTLQRGDIMVAGAEWGKVRALIDERGQNIEQAIPSQPTEILGLAGAPEPGQFFVVVRSEARAREITEYRARQIRNKVLAPTPRTSLEHMMAKLRNGNSEILDAVSFVIKADTQGSVEAITQSIEKISGEHLQIRIAHGAAGAISESDVLLAATCNAPIVAFNVRASNSVRETAEKQGVEIRYYSIIYDLLDDVRSILSGMLPPEKRETFIGYADILEIFDISKTGKVAGCKITEGVVRRGCGFRLLRDNIVLHKGELATLRRFKKEVDEVASGLECGMAFTNYQDIRPGDRIECFTVEEIARVL